jgi:hypothetical protein
MVGWCAMFSDSCLLRTALGVELLSCYPYSPLLSLIEADIGFSEIRDGIIFNYSLSLYNDYLLVSALRPHCD